MRDWGDKQVEQHQDWQDGLQWAFFEGQKVRRNGHGEAPDHDPDMLAAFWKGYDSLGDDVPDLRKADPPGREFRPADGA